MSSQPESESLIEACPGCGGLLDVSEQEPFSSVFCPSCGTQMRARTQFRNFKILQILGVGGMGTVFRAQDLNLHREVALKILKKEYSSNPEDVGRIEREARITASVNHPNVIKIYSFGSDHGQFFLAMELADKGSLDDLMNLQGTISELQVLEIGIQVASGLEAARSSGLIHRDVKPGNILFTDAHMTKIVDFGLALLMDEEAAQRGEIWGTPYYIAPEKLDNRPEDFRSDMYSLGATMFHAIAGRPPYEANTASMVALKHLKSQPVSLQAFAPGVSSETSYVINRMLDKEPEARYQSYKELIDHLRYAQEQVTAKLSRPNDGRSRVVVEDEETVTVMGWVSLILLIIFFIGMGFVFFNWQRIIGNAPTPIAQPVGDVRRGVTSDDLKEESMSAFAEACEVLARGDFEQAHQLFIDLRETTEAPEIAGWATLHSVLTGLLTDRRDEVIQTTEARLPSAIRDPDLRNLFRQIRHMRSVIETNDPSQTVNTEAFNSQGIHQFAILVGGIVNWQNGAFDEAAAALRVFTEAPTPEELPWLAKYRQFPKSYLRDYENFKQARETAAAAQQGDINARRRAMLKIQNLSNQVLTGPLMRKAYDDLIKSLDNDP